MITIHGVSAENWRIQGGSNTPNNYSTTANQGFSYEYTNETNAFANMSVVAGGCSGGICWSETGSSAVNPQIANRTDFAPFSTVNLLFWHPDTAQEGVIRFTAPSNGGYYVNTTHFTGASGSTNVSIRKNSRVGEAFYSVVVGSNTYATETFSTNLNAGESIIFILNPNGVPNFDSSGITINISSVTSVTNFSITAQDNFDGSSILNFSANVSGTIYSTTTGTIITSTYNNATLKDITIFNSNNSLGAYFNRTYSNYNVTNNLQASLIQTEIRIVPLEKITNNTLSGTIQPIGSSGTSKFTNETFNFKATTYNLTYLNASYSSAFNKTQEFTFTPLQNTTIYLIDVYNQILNFTAKDILTNAQISGFTIQLNSTTGYSETQTTSGINISMQTIKNLNYTAYINSNEYAINNITNFDYINNSATQYNKTFLLYKTNSINIYIYDESTNSLILQNTTINYLSNITEIITNTSTGTIFISNLTPNIYTFRFSTENYSDRTYQVTISTSSTQNLNVYLAKNTSDTTLTILDDSNSQTLNNVQASMYRFINGSWSVVETKLSNIIGTATFNYIPNERYKFYLTLNGYASKEFELNPITSSTYTIRMIPTTQITIDNTIFIGVDFYPTSFINGIENNLTFLIQSPTGNLQTYNLTIEYPTGRINNSGNNAIGGSFFNRFNITNAGQNSRVVINYTYVDSEDRIYTNSYSYPILNSSNSGTFINNRLQDYGLGWFEKVIIATLITFIIAGLVGILGGSSLGGIMGVIMFSYFSYINFIPVWSMAIMGLITLAILSRRT
jgi:hypothetical protein